MSTSTTSPAVPDPSILTIPYKHQHNGQPILLDCHLPPLPEPAKTSKPIPAVVFFHGGGLNVGNRTSWMPRWLKERLNAKNCAFLSADYRLIPPSTGYDVREDVTDALSFVSGGQINDALAEQGYPMKIDGERIAVAGASAGGWCAYLTAGLKQKPKSIVSMYGLGGDMLTEHYTTPKTAPFFRGRPLLDPTHFAAYIHPASNELSVTSDSPIAYDPQTGYPANPRQLLAPLYLQLGTFLDYVTGEHGLSALAREERKARVRERHAGLFPQLEVSTEWPPTFLVHGAADTAVFPHESETMEKALKEKGVRVELRVVEGMDHAFDLSDEAQKNYSALFDEVAGFMLESLSAGSS